jgi:hypothetical protein
MRAIETILRLCGIYLDARDKDAKAKKNMEEFKEKACAPATQSAKLATEYTGLLDRNLARLAELKKRQGEGENKE